MNKKEEAIYSRNYALEEQRRQELEAENNYIDDSGRVHRDRRVLDVVSLPQGIGRRATDKTMKVDKPRYKAKEMKGSCTGPDRRVKSRGAMILAVSIGRRSTDPYKELEKHPGFVPGVKTKQLEPEPPAPTRLRIPLFYTIKEACLEAIQEDREYQEDNLPCIKAKELSKSYSIPIDSALAIRIMAEGKVEAERYDKVSGTTDVLKGVKREHSSGRELLNSREDKPIEADNWKHRSQAMRCHSCMYYVPKVRPPRADHATVLGLPPPALGRCRRRSPTLSGWPAMFPGDWCGDHKLDEAKV